MEDIKTYIGYTAKIIEVLGVIAIVVGNIRALIRFIFSIQNVVPRSYVILRQELGKSVLLGLEILIAADIIATVVTQPTMDRVLILGLIILIRTFLSISIQMDIEGKFPWKKAESK